MLFVTSPTTEAVFNPIFTALNAMPRIALAPLFIIWFGLGLGSKVAVGFSLTFFIVLTSTVAGGRGVNPDHITLARTLGASESQIFRKFVLPSAVPVIFNGLRLGLVFALLGVIGSEILASENGLGQTLSVLAASFKTNGVFGIIFLLSMIGVGISWGMTSLENRLLGGGSASLTRIIRSGAANPESRGGRTQSSDNLGIPGSRAARARNDASRHPTANLTANSTASTSTAGFASASLPETSLASA